MGRNTVAMTGSPGAAPVFLRELGRCRIALSDAASASFGPKPLPRIGTRYATGSTTAARTGRPGIIRSRRRASSPAPRRPRRRPDRHPGPGKRGSAIKRSPQWNRYDREKARPTTPNPAHYPSRQHVPERGDGKRRPPPACTVKHVFLALLPEHLPEVRAIRVNPELDRAAGSVHAAGNEACPLALANITDVDSCSVTAVLTNVRTYAQPSGKLTKGRGGEMDESVLALARPTRLVPRIRTISAAALVAAAGHAASQEVPCGGDLHTFLNGLVEEAAASGLPRTVAEKFFATAALDPEVIRMDGKQGIFAKPFTEFALLVMSDYRKAKSFSFEREHRQILDRIEADHGIGRGVLLAFLALETDFGVNQGDFNTLNALVTLAHDCRRPQLFRPNVLAALELYRRGDLDPVETTGAWAGEIGMIQMLPADLLAHGVDGDGDGRVDIEHSVADALMSAADILTTLGWRANEPWLLEAVLPADFDWSTTGLETELPVSDWKTMGAKIRHEVPVDDSVPASLLLPQGRKGPAFLAPRNFRVYLEWNRSFVYAMSAAFFATHLQGTPLFVPNQPDPPLPTDEIMELQSLLADRGYDAGPVDGVVGGRTRRAAQLAQVDFGLPADGWPTPELIERLRTPG